jgi:hypothetical protein
VCIQATLAEEKKVFTKLFLVVKTCLYLTFELRGTRGLVVCGLYFVASQSFLFKIQWRYSLAVLLFSSLINFSLYRWRLESTKDTQYIGKVFDCSGRVATRVYIDRNEEYQPKFCFCSVWIYSIRFPSPYSANSGGKKWLGRKVMAVLPIFRTVNLEIAPKTRYSYYYS